MINRVVLIGLSGSGKSTVGALLAQRLGWRLIDTDDEIEREAGMPIADIFATRGEAEFRTTERRQLAAALAGSPAVVACGGGAVIDPAVWEADLLRRDGVLVVALDAEPETSLRRLSNHQDTDGRRATRPLVAGADPLGNLRAMKSRRQAAYDRADITLIVDRTSPETLAGEIARLVQPPEPDTPDIVLEAASGRSEIRVEPGLASALPELVRRRWPKARRVWFVTDENVAALHGETMTAAFGIDDFDVRLLPVPAGEGSKSIDGVSRVYDWTLQGGVERSDVMIALGGGMVGDLTGFAAATVLRGIGFAQVPTTLLATVDSSVGGKTGINHAVGKNLIGAFYQPPVVAIDPLLLQTAPEREFRSGWAEIIKHAFIQPATPGGERADLTRFLRRNATALNARAEPALSYLIRRNVSLKTAVVAADERETGIRAYLNFGHTLGHAIEASGYELLHGEAIALGMLAALSIGEHMGLNPPGALDETRDLIREFGLPVSHPVQTERVLAFLHSDKKRAAGKQRWVLPVPGGGVAIRDDVSEEITRRALASINSGLN